MERITHCANQRALVSKAKNVRTHLRRQFRPFLEEIRLRRIRRIRATLTPHHPHLELPKIIMSNSGEYPTTHPGIYISYIQNRSVRICLYIQRDSWRVRIVCITAGRNTEARPFIGQPMQGTIHRICTTTKIYRTPFFFLSFVSWLPA